MYQPEFDEPWAFGLVSQHDPVSHIMEITMDQVCMKATFTTVYMCKKFLFTKDGILHDYVAGCVKHVCFFLNRVRRHRWLILGLFM